MSLSEMTEMTKQEVSQDEIMEPTLDHHNPEVTVVAAEKANLRDWLVVAVVASAVASIVVALAAPGVFLSAVTADIGGASVQNWLPFVAQVVQAAVSPPVNHATDMLGRKWAIIVSLLTGTAGSIVMATANTMPVAIGGAALSGVCFVAQPLLYTVASEVVPHRQRGQAQAVMNMGTGMGGVLAICFGGLFIVHNAGGNGGWRWLYYFQGIFFAFNALIFGLVYHPSPTPNPLNETVRERLSRLDVTGSILLAGGTVPLCMGLIWGGNAYPWKSVQVLAPLLIGLLAFAALAIHQTRYQKQGLFHHELFKLSRNFLICVFLIFVEGFVFICFNLFYNMATAVLWEQRPLQQGLRALPIFIGYLVGSPLCGWWVTRYKTTRAPLLLGYSFFLAAVIGMSTATPGAQKVAVAYAAFVGLGISVPLNFLVVVCQFAVPVELLALGSSLLLASRCIGGVMGAAITSAIYTSKLSASLTNYITAAAINAGAPAASISIIVAGVTGGNTTLAASTEGVTSAILTAAAAGAASAHAYSFHYVWFTVLPFVILSLITCFFIDDISHKLNATIDRPLVGSHTKAVTEGQEESQ